MESDSMKKALIIFLILLLLGGAIFCGWYFLWTAENFASLGDSSMASGRYSRAATLYEEAAKLSPDTPEYTEKLADAYIADGSYTKAERTLVNAIRVNPSTALYCKLSSVYVAQDKLLDAQQMLDRLTDPVIAAEIAVLRPAAPTLEPAGGQFTEYIDLAMKADGGTVCYSLTEQYPSTQGAAYTAPLSLTAGTTQVQAIVVGDNGLVSPLVEAEYLIVGVVEEVDFASAELEAFLRETLYIPRTSAVLTSDLWAIAELEVPTDVTDYSDLRYFTNLTSLRIDESTSSDFSFLAYTTKLEKLYLPAASISGETLDFIGQLTALTELDLSYCGISNIGALSNLTELTDLNLSGNSISDITPLSGLRHLSVLNLSNNALTSVEALGGTTSLTQLDVSENTLTTVRPLAGCTALITFNGNNNRLTDITPLASCRDLVDVRVSNNFLADVSVLSSCAGLQRLEAANNKLTSIDIMAALPSLTYVDISYNSVSAIPQLSADACLQQFYASYNQLSDVSPLMGLTQLTYVDVDYNEEIEDILCLVSCYLLVQVDAFGTKVEEVADLTNMGVIVNFDPTTAPSYGS